MTSTPTTFDYAQYRDVLNPQFADYLEREPYATRVWNYQPRVVAGWLQTDAYMLALNAGTGQPGTPVETRDRRVAVRRARRLLLDTAEQVHVVLDEAVFWRQADADHPSEQVWREQIEQLRQASGRPQVTIQVLPFQRSIRRGSQGPTTVLTFRDRSGLVYREGYDSESLSHDPARVEQYEEQFRLLADAAVGLEPFLATADRRQPPAWLSSPPHDPGS